MQRPARRVLRGRARAGERTDFMRAALHCCEYDELKLLFETEVSKEETLELVVPDVCADVASVLDVRGQLLLSSQKAKTNEITMSASVDVKVICVSEDGTVQCVTGVVPFEQSIAAEGVSENDCVIARCCLSNVEARTLNPRKLLLRAEVSIYAAAYGQQKASFCDGLAAGADSSIHLLQKEFDCCVVRSVRDKSFTVSDEYRLPADRGKELKLLSTVTAVNNVDVKGVGTKLIIKARADTTAVFLNTADGNLFDAAFSTEFSQIVEADAAGEDVDDTAFLQIKDAEFTCIPGREEGFAVSAQLYLTAQTIRREKRRQTYIADAYSNSQKLMVETERLKAPSCPSQRELHFELREKLPQKTPLSEISYVAVSTVYAEANVDSVTIRARLGGAGKDADGMPASVSMELYGKQDIDTHPGAKLTVLSVSSSAPSVIGASGEAELALSVTVVCAVASGREITAVMGITCDESAPALERGPSLIVLCSEREADLWSLAKKYRSTTDAIRAANGGEAVFDPAHRPLLIPRAR